MIKKNEFQLVICILFISLIQGCNSEYGGDISSPTTTANIVSNGKSLSCDTVLNKQYYEICYDNEYKGALAVSYMLFGDKVNALNIEERPSFYIDTTLPKEYASKPSDYTGSGYDRGHLANDASFDYSEVALKSTYVMSNIVPQEPSLNGYGWSDTEKEERKLAKEYGEVGVIIGVVYDENPPRIGSDAIAVPSAFYKTIFSASGYQACYYYENLPLLDVEKDELDNHKVDCATLTLNYDGMRNISFDITTQKKPTPTPTKSPSKVPYSCQTKKTCSSISSCDEAYFYLGSCGFSNLDKNKDGVPCETLCD